MRKKTRDLLAAKVGEGHHLKQRLWHPGDPLTVDGVPAELAKWDAEVRAQLGEKKTAAIIDAPGVFPPPRSVPPPSELGPFGPRPDGYQEAWEEIEKRATGLQQLLIDDASADGLLRTVLHALTRR